MSTLHLNRSGYSNKQIGIQVVGHPELEPQRLVQESYGIQSQSLGVHKLLRTLRQQLADLTNEDALLRGLKVGLETAESLCRADWTQFSAEVLEELREARDCRKALERFLELREDLADVRSKEEALELMDKLREISSHFERHAVRRRIEKEYRELSERLDKLPLESVARVETKLKIRISQLNGSPRDCGKCGSPMILHLGRTKPFWGCSTFPACYGRNWLTKEERRFLELE